MNRTKEAKLAAVSCAPNTGARRLLYLTTDKVGAGMIRSAARSYGHRSGVQLQVTVKSTYCHERAATEPTPCQRRVWCNRQGHLRITLGGVRAQIRSASWRALMAVFAVAALESPESTVIKESAGGRKSPSNRQIPASGQLANLPLLFRI